MDIGGGSHEFYSQLWQAYIVADTDVHGILPGLGMIRKFYRFSWRFLGYGAGISKNVIYSYNVVFCEGNSLRATYRPLRDA